MYSFLVGSKLFHQLTYKWNVRLHLAPETPAALHGRGVAIQVLAPERVELFNANLHKMHIKLKCNVSSNKTSAPIGAWKVNFLTIEDFTTDRPTDRKTNRPIIDRSTDRPTDGHEGS